MPLADNQVHCCISIPSSLTNQKLQTYHDCHLSGHGGIFKTYKKLYETAFWTEMWTDIKQFVRRCVKCQTLKANNQKPARTLQQHNVSYPTEMLGMNIMGLFPHSSEPHEYVRVVVDYCK